jgi:hypothetical protein
VLVDALRWLSAFADGPCCVVVHGDPYECAVEDCFWRMHRVYPSEFYLKAVTR